MPEIMRITNITINEKANTSTNNTTNMISTTDDYDIYKILYECTRDMGRYRQFVYYIGTSLDNRKLRIKIQKLQEKIFKNLMSQKDSIIRYTKSSYNNPKDKAKLGKLLCFTLSIVSYLECLIEKLGWLLLRFPSNNENTVNLGFEDSLSLHDEPNSDHDDRKAADALNDHNELKNRIKYLISLKDEIEQIDVYQLRFNAPNESHEFVKHISAYNDDMRRLSMDDDDCKIKSFLQMKNCSRRKFICVSIIVIIVIIIIVGIISGIIYASK